MKYNLLWALSRDNPKTGVILTGWPDDFDAAKASCRGCRQMTDRSCYAWNGTLPRALWSILKVNDGKRYTLENCIASAKRLRKSVAKAARFGPIGDPRGVFKGVLMSSVKTLRAENLAILAYTHFWHQKSAAFLREFCRASCDDVASAERAQSEGWSTSVILPWDYERRTFWVGSTRGIVCPVQRGVNTTCNECRACDIQRNTRPIGFIDHSCAARAARTRKLKMASAS